MQMIVNRKFFFTIIELLMVIAIIIILSSILLPALGKAKAKSIQIKCAGNMKQISTAIQMYAQDYNGWTPYGTYTPNSLFNEVTMGGIADYLGVPSYYKSGNPGYYHAPPIAICPEGGRDGTKNTSIGGTSPNHSYSINCYLSNAYTTIQRMANVRNPSSRLLIGDIGPDGWFNISNTGHGTCLYSRELFGYKHFRRTNIIFVDGHLGFLGPYQIPVNAFNASNDPNAFYKSFQ